LKLDTSNLVYRCLMEVLTDKR